MSNLFLESQGFRVLHLDVKTKGCTQKVVFQFLDYDKGMCYKHFLDKHPSFIPMED